MELKLDALQTILDDFPSSDPRAKKIKAQELFDRVIWMRWRKTAFWKNCKGPRD